MGEIGDITEKSIQLEEELIANRKLYQKSTTQLKNQLQTLSSKVSGISKKVIWIWICLSDLTSLGSQCDSYEMQLSQALCRNEELEGSNRELKKSKMKLEGL